MSAPHTQPVSLHLELHMIRSVNPSNLNRDDAGAPKDAMFGGVRRLRFSSQSQKYSWRQDFKISGYLIDTEIGIRSRTFADQITKTLIADGLDPETAETATMHALVAANLAELPKFKKAPAKAKAKGKKVAQPEPEPEEEEELEAFRTGALMFLSRAEIDRMTALIAEHADALVALDVKKKESKPVKAMRALVKNLLLMEGDGRPAADIGMFGRMIAQHPSTGVDGAVHVANAISTHGLNQREYDYYTAIDDLRNDEQSGSSMIGSNEFSSGTLYQYLTVNVRDLLGTLEGDTDLLMRSLEALIRAAVLRIPGGRNSSSASYLMPALSLITIRQGSGPRNLVNAFERPIRDRDGEGYVTPSISALGAELDWQNRGFGAPAVAMHLSRITDCP